VSATTFGEIVPPPPVGVDRRPLLVSYGYALIVGLTLGHFLLGLPIQFSDSFGQMLKLSASWADLLRGEFTQQAFMRPLDWGLMKLVYDLSGGNYYAWFRGTHVVQVVVLTLMYVALVRPRTLHDTALLPLGFAVLVGVHTFQGTVREAYPLNHFMEVLLYCFAAAIVVTRPYSRWNDLMAGLLFVAAALTIESGLLVWVILVGGVLVGGTGISRGCVVALFVLLGAYFVLRFPVLGVGAPDLVERSSGFGFQILDPPELVERFETNRWRFYAYNVAASILSVLFSEPQSGVFWFTRDLLDGDVNLASLASVVASTGSALLIALFVWRRRHAWMARRFGHDDRLIVLFLMVLGANGVISYPYVKDVVMSPAGAFLAVAVYLAARGLIGSLPTSVSPRAFTLVVAGFALLGTAWAIRVADAHLSLRNAAAAERNEWAYVQNSMKNEGVTLGEAETTLFRRLREDAIFLHPAPPPLEPPVPSAWIGDQ
jgi:hypothetical protein